MWQQQQEQWQKVTPQSALVLANGKCSRTISSVVISGRLSPPPLTKEQVADWWKAIENIGPFMIGEVANLGEPEGLIPAHIEPLMDAWLAEQGIGSLGPKSSISPLACIGSGFHHDAQGYPNHVFCVLWLSEDTPWDLVFPYTDTRVPLDFGTVVLFDSAQPHGVVARGQAKYDPNTLDYREGRFVSKDLQINRQVREVMKITKMSRKGKLGYQMLNKDGYREDLDLADGSWHMKKVG